MIQSAFELCEGNFISPRRQSRRFRLVDSRKRFIRIVRIRGVAVKQHAILLSLLFFFASVLQVRGDDFVGKDLKSRDFQNRVLNGADFTNSTLDYANFTGASLKKANFSGAAINFTNFNRCDLTEANFQGPAARSDLRSAESASSTARCTGPTCRD